MLEQEDLQVAAPADRGHRASRARGDPQARTASAATPQLASATAARVAVASAPHRIGHRVAVIEATRRVRQPEIDRRRVNVHPAKRRVLVRIRA